MPAPWAVAAGNGGRGPACGRARAADEDLGRAPAAATAAVPRRVAALSPSPSPVFSRLSSSHHISSSRRSRDVRGLSTGGCGGAAAGAARGVASGRGRGGGGTKGSHAPRALGGHPNASRASASARAPSVPAVPPSSPPPGAKTANSRAASALDTLTLSPSPSSPSLATAASAPLGPAAAAAAAASRRQAASSVTPAAIACGRRARSTSPSAMWAMMALCCAPRWAIAGDTFTCRRGGREGE